MLHKNRVRHLLPIVALCYLNCLDQLWTNKDPGPFSGYDPFYVSTDHYDLVFSEKKPALYGVWQLFGDSVNGYYSVALSLKDTAYHLDENKCPPNAICAGRSDHGDWGITNDSLQLRVDSQDIAHTFKYKIQSDSLFLSNTLGTRVLYRYPADPANWP